MLSRHLNVDEVDIDSISREHYGDLKEAALKALLKSVIVHIQFTHTKSYCGYVAIFYRLYNMYKHM